VKEGHELLPTQANGRASSSAIWLLVRLCFVRAHPRDAQRGTQRRPAGMRSEHRRERLVGQCGPAGDLGPPYGEESECMMGHERATFTHRAYTEQRAVCALRNEDD